MKIRQKSQISSKKMLNETPHTGLPPPLFSFGEFMTTPYFTLPYIMSIKGIEA